MTTASTYPALLPPNATALEDALSGAGGRLTALPSNIDRVWDWETCPSNLLPWLAWAMSVDLWDENWPDETKRSIIRESFYLHQKKGTLYGITRYISYAGGDLKRTIVPPDKAYAGASLTDEERAVWLARFAQIRIFEFRDRGHWQYSAYIGSGANKLPCCAASGGPDNLWPEQQVPRPPVLPPPDISFVEIDGVSYPKETRKLKGLMFPAQTDAWTRYGRRAFLWDKGTHPLATGREDQLGWVMQTAQIGQKQEYAYEQLRINGVFVQALFCGYMVCGNIGRKDGRLFPIERGNADKRIATVYIRRNYATEEERLLYYYPVAPGLNPIQVFPTYVAERGASYKYISMFCGMPGRWLNRETGERKRITCFTIGYVPETTAPMRLYDVIYLHDTSRLANGRPPSSYAGSMRLGMPSYHAQLSPQIIGRRSLYQFGRYVYGCVSASSMKPLRMVMDSVKRSKAERDKILLHTGLHRPIRAGDGIRSGQGYTTHSLVLDP